MLLVLQIVAFVFGSIITIYSYVGFFSMPKWKKYLLIVSTGITWVAGIWLLVLVESKSKNVEKETKKVRHEDSLRQVREDSLTGLVYKNTLEILRHKNDSLNTVVNKLMMINSKINVQRTSNGDNINTGNNSPVINRSPGATINKPLDFYTMENGILPNELLKRIQYLQEKNKLPKSAEILIGVSQECNQQQLSGQIQDFLTKKGYTAIVALAFNTSATKNISVDYSSDFGHIMINLGMFLN